MQHRAPLAARPDLTEVRTGGPVRIEGVYPPLLAPAPHVGAAGIPDADHPRVTRYDRSRHRAPKAHRPAAARAWAGASAVLAAAGVAAVVLLPQDQPMPARLDVPVAAPAPAAASAPVAAPVPASPTPALQLPPSEPVRVQIPALGVRSQVMALGLERDGSMEVPPGGYPVGWYEGSPTPGQLGPAVLAGHVDWGGEPGAFHGLRELLPGDEIVVERADGTTVTFGVDAVEEHPKEAFPTDAVYADIGHAGLRLITCGGSFDEDTGDYTDNVIVFARLSSVG
ncbi:class F sortase [Modestobacter sp. VKM Ac-2977]|uniref:class F sortase n=1 Tax=Modestobacter sp. VKM Ac-2977 TaxID=3004131 RepID=UPI0022AA18AF|nr:class F sortase [Modestobacter sp. VKM Ac-2977]MCZ2821074.1 class F sortase [Modestobacter sp. VKM Ac-2977]